jgi:hypothetical protein
VVIRSPEPASFVDLVKLIGDVPPSAAAEGLSALPQILGRTTLVSQILTSQAHREGAMQSSPRPEEVTMSTSIEPAPLEVRRDTAAGTSRISARRALLACGIVYALLYVIVNDVIAATLYDGYSRMSQAVSELSATGAPTHAFLTAVAPLFSLLLMGFGLGIWRSAHGKRSLRIAGALMVAHGATSFLWLLGPMSQREVIAAGGATSADDLHLVLSAATGLFVATYVATTAVGFGWVFRLYSLVTIATALVFGLLSAQVDKLAAGEPTPWMGLLERIGIGAWLLWMAIVAVVLWRTNRSPKVTVPATPAEPVDPVDALDARGPNGGTQ